MSCWNETRSISTKPVEDSIRTINSFELIGNFWTFQHLLPHPTLFKRILILHLGNRAKNSSTTQPIWCLCLFLMYKMKRFLYIFCVLCFIIFWRFESSAFWDFKKIRFISISLPSSKKCGCYDAFSFTSHLNHCWTLSKQVLLKG